MLDKIIDLIQNSARPIRFDRIGLAGQSPYGTRVFFFYSVQNMEAIKVNRYLEQDSDHHKVRFIFGDLLGRLEGGYLVEEDPAHEIHKFWSLSVEDSLEATVKKTAFQIGKRYRDHAVLGTGEEGHLDYVDLESKRMRERREERRKKERFTEINSGIYDGILEEVFWWLKGKQESPDSPAQVIPLYTPIPSTGNVAYHPIHLPQRTQDFLTSPEFAKLEEHALRRLAKDLTPKELVTSHLGAILYNQLTSGKVADYVERTQDSFEKYYRIQDIGEADVAARHYANWLEGQEDIVMAMDTLQDLKSLVAINHALEYVTLPKNEDAVRSDLRRYPQMQDELQSRPFDPDKGDFRMYQLFLDTMFRVYCEPQIVRLATLRELV